MESPFKDLFVLELARNHWGSVERGKEIIRQYAEVVRANGVRACVKLQAFDTDNFIHKDFLPKEGDVADGENLQAPGSHTRYIKKTLATKLSDDEFAELINEIKAQGMETMVTPYDERSVELCGKLDVDMMKLASSDSGSITLLEKVIELGKPLSISTGAITLENIDRIVKMAKEANLPLLVNQCVSNYPSEDCDLEMNQIDFWKERYPDVAIGFSSHDYCNIGLSHSLAVAKGAISYERHIDIESEDKPVSKYCIIPEQADAWFKAHKLATDMLGGSSESVRDMTDIEKGYLKSVNRGVYALRDLKKGETFTHEGLGKDFYLAIPLQDGQISSSELNNPYTLTDDVAKDEMISHSVTSS